MNPDPTLANWLGNGPVIWGMALIVAFPLLTVVLSELIGRLRRAGQPIVKTLGILRNLLLPTLLIWLLLARVIELEPSSLAMKIASTVVWIFLIHAGLSLIRDVVFESAAAGTWQARVPKLMLDLARTVLVLIGGAIVLSTVWEADLASLATALGVGSIVIGLALQEPMGNLFAGMALLLERPLSEGDWITVEGTTGKVIEINWRSVHILTTGREVRIVPNSSLYKGSFSNLSRPDNRRTDAISIGFSYDDPPNKVKQVMLETLAGTPGVMDDPAPQVFTDAYGDSAIQYKLRFTVAHQDRLEETRAELLTRVWYAADRHGLTIPYPTSAQIELTREDLEARRRIDPGAMLRRFPQFAGAAEGEAAGLLARGTPRHYARGEHVVLIGQSLAGLYLILDGQASLSVRDRSGVDQEICRLGAGEYFGEQSMLRSHTSDVTVAAIEDLHVLILDVGLLEELVDKMPRLAREIGNLMDLRRKAAISVRKASASPR
ncbi:MAG: mechanosensitive ion channel family protein [Isosphaeraceae bacterium]